MAVDRRWVVFQAERLRRQRGQFAGPKARAGGDGVQHRAVGPADVREHDLGLAGRVEQGHHLGVGQVPPSAYLVLVVELERPQPGDWVGRDPSVVYQPEAERPHGPEVVVRRRDAQALVLPQPGELGLDLARGDARDGLGPDPVEHQSHAGDRPLDVIGRVVLGHQVLLEGVQVFRDRHAGVVIHRVRQTDLAALQLSQYLRLQHARGGLVVVRLPLLPPAVGHAEPHVPLPRLDHDAVATVVHRHRERPAARVGPLGELLAPALDDGRADRNRTVMLTLHEHVVLHS
ncbi:MAG TPA: hypothetical protein PLD58_05445 [Phycisphaerae bacterium]|nr:hypothetical protein [Phycisphaerae bacterium]